MRRGGLRCRYCACRGWDAGGAGWSWRRRRLWGGAPVNTTRLRHEEAMAWEGDGTAVARRGWDGGCCGIEEEELEVGTVGRSMGK